MALDLMAVASLGVFPSDRDPITRWYTLALSLGLFEDAPEPPSYDETQRGRYRLGLSIVID